MMAGGSTWRAGRWATASLGLSALAGCASVPAVSPTVGRPVSAEAPQVVGSSGPLSAAQVKALVAQLTTAPGDNVVLRRHLAIEQAVAETPLVDGESTQVLRDGPTSFRAMFAAIAAARRQIDLEYYIFEDVDSDGAKLGDLLVAKRAQGVAVNLIYDSFGSDTTPKAFFDRLRAAGVNVVEYNPLDPFKAKAGYSPNDRDHRKILVVDGKTAIVGGVNICTDYEVHPPTQPNAPPPEHWRDTDLKISGPAAAQLQALFAGHWRKQRGPPLEELTEIAAPAPTGGAVVRIIGSSPRHAVPRYYVTLISAVRSAEKSIIASTAYFVPTNDELAALTEAARRGVDVELLLPDHSDSGLSMAVGHSHYAALLKAGVKIYETHGLVLHSKTVTIDGVWSVIGSSNFDHRSVIFNDEVDAVVIGGDTAETLEAMFADDRRAAHAIDLATWNRRPLIERMKESYARVWQNLL
jgi:cardiolipin synthase